MHPIHFYQFKCPIYVHCSRCTCFFSCNNIMRFALLLLSHPFHFHFVSWFIPTKKIYFDFVSVAAKWKPCSVFSTSPSPSPIQNYIVSRYISDLKSIADTKCNEHHRTTSDNFKNWHSTLLHLTIFSTHLILKLLVLWRYIAINNYFLFRSGCDFVRVFVRRANKASVCMFTWRLCTRASYLFL